ncbi:hypothetical protein Gotur_012884 [Gossypium turneri]
MQSPGPMRAPTQSPDVAVQLMIPMQPPFQMMQGGPSGSSPFYQSPPTYGFQTPSPFVMQTPPHTLFFEGGSSSQLRELDAVLEELESPLEEQQPPSEARERRNLAHNRRRPPCGTESLGHRH